ncbi:MAG TPA: hypothetical protein VKI00_30490 [Mycobacterium sp.]|uniref:hypothetical protein n=1 Tax=Mycobacterium sp. TaxID=1785 RepID=UPI002C806F85|nr:hypothetical protein [Mycobacterium sp.]HME79837.1 hypothetical protein [Mycobacterium sp.]
MERLPYIDEHAITVAASREDTWSALLRVMCRDPQNPSTVPAGFVLDEAQPPARFALKGRHPFAIYRWVFELEAEAPQRTRVRAATWAAFPGLHGSGYRALVIGTGGHRVAVRWMLKRIAAVSITDDADDYVDTFEVPIVDGDLRTAEQAFRDGLGDKPGVGGNVVWWIHRHLLQFRLGPFSSPQHVIGWTIVRSGRDEIVLAADGPLMRGQLRLHREDGSRAVLTTSLRYRRKIAASAVWFVVGPLHRILAPQLMQRSARRGVILAVR